MAGSHHSDGVMWFKHKCVCARVCVCVCVCLLSAGKDIYLPAVEGNTPALASTWAKVTAWSLCCQQAEPRLLFSPSHTKITSTSSSGPGLKESSLAFSLLQHSSNTEVQNSRLLISLVVVQTVDQAANTQCLWRDQVNAKTQSVQVGRF